MQQGRYVARVIRLRRRGKPVAPFRYFDRGTMATIGRAKAVADVGGIRFAGLLAWIAWLTIHLMFLVQFQNRVLVLIQWAWNYTTRNSPARLITGRDPAAHECEAGAPQTIAPEARAEATRDKATKG